MIFGLMSMAKKSMEKDKQKDVLDSLLYDKAKRDKTEKDIRELHKQMDDVEDVLGIYIDR